MAKEEKKAPKLRFNGYTNDWERKELNNILKINSGRDYKQLNSGSIPVYGTGGYMLSVNDKLSDTDAVGIGRKGTIDKPLYLKAPFWTVDTLFYCTSKENSDVKFIYLLFQIINWKRYDESTGVPSLSKNTISNIKTYVPKIKEQDYISKLFFSLDNTLQLHERKCEELILIKKALLQKLFPKREEVRSEVRYKNFSDAWKQRKLRDVVKTTIGEFVIKTKQKEDSPYPVYNGGTSYTGFYDDYNNDSNKIIISARGANAGFVNIVRQRYWAGNSCYSLSILNNQEMDLDYLYQMLKQRQHLFTDFQQAANIPSVSKKDVETFKVYTPSFEEQKKIGLFLTRFDSLIDLHQRKLEKLKQLKKFLLQNMFI